MRAYQCKVSIKDSKPPVWWRIFIPAEISFSSLSLLLEDLSGEELGDSFRFEIYQKARVWEPGKEHPLAADHYYDAYSAAHTPISCLFDKGRSVYAKGIGKTLKIEVEKRDEDYPFSYPLLVKMRADVDGQALHDKLKNRFVIREEEGPALGRTELLRLEKDGALSIPRVTAAPNRGETYEPSSNTLLLEVASNLKKLVANGSGSKWRMRPLLLSYSENDLQELAHSYNICDVETKTPETLSDELCALLLKPETVQKTFLLLSDDEIRTFEAAVAADGPYRLSEEETDGLDTLIDKGYVFIDNDWTTVNIPLELPALYRAINTAEFDKKRRQLNWIMRCMNDIVPPYYALMPLRQFCRLCRRTKDPQISPEEVAMLLHDLPEGSTECVVTADKIYARELDEDRDTFDYVVAVQGDKPWHIMREREITDLLTYGYPPHEWSYRKFKKFLQNSLRLDDVQIESITRRIHLLSAYGHKAEAYFRVFETCHLKLTRRQTEELSKLFQDISNNTPTFYNRGFTPNQMAEMR